MNRTALAASLALALTVNLFGNAAHAQPYGTSWAGQSISSLSGATASATLVPQPATRVNTTTADYQDLRTSSALDDGGYLLVWETSTINPTQDGSSYYLQRFDGAGNKVGGETRLQLTVKDFSIAVLSNGEIVVAYREARDAQGNVIPAPNAASGAFFQKFNASGSQIMRETAVATSIGTSAAYGVTAVPLSNGNFVVSWTSQFQSSGTVQNNFSAQNYDSLGQRSGSPIVLSTDSYPPTRPIEYSIQAAPDGGYLLFKRTIDTSNYSGCFGAMSEPTITSISYYDVNLVSRQILAPTHCGDLMPLKGNQYMIFGANATGPYSQLIDANGQSIGVQKPIAARTPFRSPELTIFTGRTVLADGSYLLFWLADTVGARGQRYTSKGDELGEPFNIVYARPKSILPLSGGDVIVGWSSSTEIGSDLLDVYTQRLTNPDVAACTKPAAWVNGQYYAAGARVSYSNGLTYIAKFANPGYDPTISTYFWALAPCSVSPPPPAVCTNLAAWVNGQYYAAGDRITYSDGLTYVAKFANPGYNPTISTYYWAPATCSVSPPPPVVCTKPAAWVNGQYYAAGARVSYSDGLTYVAKFANPGYIPTVSTYFWAPGAC